MTWPVAISVVKGWLLDQELNALLVRYHRDIRSEQKNQPNCALLIWWSR